MLGLMMRRLGFMMRRLHEESLAYTGVFYGVVVLMFYVLQRLWTEMMVDCRSSPRR